MKKQYQYWCEVCGHLFLLGISDEKKCLWCKSDKIVFEFRIDRIYLSRKAHKINKK